MSGCEAVLLRAAVAADEEVKASVAVTPIGDRGTRLCGGSGGETGEESEFNWL